MLVSLSIELHSSDGGQVSAKYWEIIVYNLGSIKRKPSEEEIRCVFDDI